MLPNRRRLFYGGALAPSGEPTYPAMSRAFTILLALLVVGFFFIPEQHQRNWLLYLTAAAAHAFLFDRSSVRIAFAGHGGWVVPGLLVVPLLSLLWSDAIEPEGMADLLLAGYCILLIYLGVACLARQHPLAFGHLLQTLLAAANLGALLSLGTWAANYDPSLPRLPGVLGLDNPVHGSILLLSATLPVWNGVARRSLAPRWLLACAAPCAFALLAGPRTALAAYVVVIACVLGLRFRPTVVFGGGLLVALAGVLALLGSDALRAIWLDRGLSFRPEIWSATWSAYQACNPLLGCGIGTPLQVDYSSGLVTGRAHSLYVAALYHQGLLGIAVFLGATGWLLNRARTAAAAPEQQTRPANVSALLGNQQQDWALMLIFALLASTTSGDHLLVRTTLFWCYFWLPVMVLAALTATSVSERENSPADPA